MSSSSTFFARKKDLNLANFVFDLLSVLYFSSTVYEFWYKVI